MYVRKIEIKNIRSIKHLTWEIEPEATQGWHVILGNNGTGKSSFVRSAALAFIGVNESRALRENWIHWLRPNYSGRIHVYVIVDKQLDECKRLDRDDLSPTLGGHTSKAQFQTFINEVQKGKEQVVDLFILRAGESTVLGHTTYPITTQIWGDSTGWFCASYGPFRRFTGGDTEYEKLFQSNPKLARHLTAFDEKVALAECLKWLQHLRFEQLEEEEASGDVLDHVREFINQDGFLPFGAKLKAVSSKGVTFVDGNGFTVAVEELSDGFRSILSLTLDLIRHLVIAYGEDKVFDAHNPNQITVPGIVLIDEVDAHLHPTWQREIGIWLTRLFPNIQFIVTTHSPLVCQAATTIFRLPTPGTDEQGEMITGTEFERLRYGNVLEAYGTEAFGVGVTRSEEGEKKMGRLAELNIKELDEGLTREEKKEQEELRAMFPTTAHNLPNEVAA